MIWTYENVRRALNGDDERTFPNLAATRFVRGADGVFHLEYHGSRIVTYHPDGTYTLDTCGYKTRTTKARLRKFGPLNIRSKNGRWILNSQGGGSRILRRNSSRLLGQGGSGRGRRSIRHGNDRG